MSTAQVSHRAIEGGGAVVVVSGELDLATAPGLKSALLELFGSGERRFVLDFSAVTHMDSTGLSVLIGFKGRLPDSDALVIAGASDAVRRVFQVTGVEEQFALSSTVDEALSAWGTRVAVEAPGLSQDAAIAVGLASTALPFAESQAAEVQQWLRILRLHGDAGRALRSLELGDAPRAAIEQLDGEQGASPAAAGCAQRIDEVVARAKELAAERGARAVGTGHMLEGVITVYGAEFDRVLRVYGGDIQSLIERLSVESA